MIALNNKRIVGGIFFDLEKAFDCVTHDILLAKMEYYGIRGVIYTLIKYYLQNRYQSVKFNNKFSKWDKINMRVPQGSVLGPLFFSIYINNLPFVIPYTVSNKSSSVLLFASDTSVIVTESCLMNCERKLNVVFQIMKEWFNSDFLLLNFDKTLFIVCNL